MKILVIQQKMIGDVLATSIVCNNLKKMYPDATIDFLIYPFTKPVVENNPNIDHLILFEDAYRESKKEFFRFLLDIRKAKYDLVIDAYGKLESNLIVAFSGAKTKIGFHKSHTNFIYTKTTNTVSQTESTAGLAIESRLNLVRAVNNAIALDVKPKIFLTENEIENGKKILQNHTIVLSEKLYMIGVLGSSIDKTYPFKFMAELLDFIVKQTRATLLFNYIPSQISEAKAIYDLCQKETQSHIKIDLIPGSIREFLSITYYCDALIGNEGGAVNMAKALDIPTFTIFSTWIKKESWNSFEDEKTNVSVHLKDFKPEIYGDKSPKKMKKEALNLYQLFIPSLIFPMLKKYLKN